MKIKNETLGKIEVIAAFIIFGTVGPVRRLIPLPSGFISLLRGVSSSLFLCLVAALIGKKVSFKKYKKQLIPLIVSGVFIGVNWVALFESYNHTSVATATVCYYLAPIFVIILSPFFLKEKITPFKVICGIVAFSGSVLVSGIIGNSDGNLDLTGVILATVAAVFYGLVTLFNRKYLKEVDAYSKSVVQLFTAGITVIPFVLITEKLDGNAFTPVCIIALAVVCLIHTGVAFGLYFAGIGNVNAVKAALLSYIDPVIAILISAFILKEPISVYQIIGSVLIIAAALLSELNIEKYRNQNN